MRKTLVLGLLVAGIGAATVTMAVGCANGGSGAGAGGSSGEGGSDGGGTGEGGSGASGPSTTSTTNPSTTSTTSTSTSPSTTTSTGPGGGSPASHVLISEVGVTPGGGEFIELYNPTASDVSLDDYFLSDNASYTTFAEGKPWNPPTDNPGTDFLAGFPAGTKIKAGDVLVIASSPKNFEDAHSLCPNFVLVATDYACSGGGTAKAMVAPANGGIGDKFGSLLSNSREMVVLFQFGAGASTLKDVDYVTWGTEYEEPTRADKSSVPGYAPDTPKASQSPANAPGENQSIERCDASEPGEKTSGGNGLSGHDETSENLAASFQVTSSPSPGTKNACLN